MNMHLRAAKKIGPDDELFSVGHFFGEYLPRRLLFVVIPIAIAVLFFNGNENAKLFLFIFTGFMAIAQGYNYYYAFKKHNELAAEYGERYFEKLNSELERVGLNRLISRFWTGLEPDDE